ncbi:MAG: hypothetical protein Fur002_01740 [Anaerolineales bacterium]
MDASSEILLAQLLRGARIAGLATLRDDAPQISMAAFACADDFSEFYIHISKLAQHTMDMIKDKRVSLLIAEPDDGRNDPQTLTRVSLRAYAEKIQNGEPGHALIKQIYLTKFPASAALFDLADFSLWRIKPRGGRFVAGFGKAYNITTDTLQKAAKGITPPKTS